jgi:hypothetical protein
MTVECTGAHDYTSIQTNGLAVAQARIFMTWFQGMARNSCTAVEGAPQLAIDVPIRET